METEYCAILVMWRCPHNDTTDSAGCLRDLGHSWDICCNTVVWLSWPPATVHTHPMFTPSHYYWATSLPLKFRTFPDNFPI